ncbi:hypothetical protein SAMN05216389_107114 [Oceanobacillus limi]|uniref:DUF3221 domain-containing protein n=1 Tax=Oceanobacillus limi TaxID=930131 RepID=A0A1I0CWE0_9BACI|nr:hypothetical protein [Oceanobacillus limi]SET24069.1 hypothetical protein SAMN05216389_107114 [Oceanobacillus limi]
MLKRKIFFIVTLMFVLISCSQTNEEYLIEAIIIEIKENTGDIEVDGPMKVVKSATTQEAVGNKTESMIHTIRVSNPEDYNVGQKVKVNVISNYDEDVWDVNRLKFEVEVVD